jgi:hypothetical protein
VATTCGRLLRFCWRWRLCANKTQKWPAQSLASSSRNSSKARCLPASWLSSRFLPPAAIRPR